MGEVEDERARNLVLLETHLTERTLLGENSSLCDISLFAAFTAIVQLQLAPKNAQPLGENRRGRLRHCRGVRRQGGGSASQWLLPPRPRCCCLRRPRRTESETATECARGRVLHQPHRRLTTCCATLALHRSHGRSACRPYYPWRLPRALRRQASDGDGVCLCACDDPCGRESPPLLFLPISHPLLQSFPFALHQHPSALHYIIDHCITETLAAKQLLEDVERAGEPTTRVLREELGECLKLCLFLLLTLFYLSSFLFLSLSLSLSPFPRVFVFAV